MHVSSNHETLEEGAMIANLLIEREIMGLERLEHSLSVHRKCPVSTNGCFLWKTAFSLHNESIKQSA